MTIKDVREIIQNLKDLPAMPNVVVIALEVIKNPNSSAKQLAHTIENDHAITSSILKIVNSSYFGLANQVTSIDKAITLLGFGEIKNIILSFAMKPMISTQGGKDIWEHSLKTAIASELLAKKLGRDNPDECFALGLLHDMGKLVFMLYNPAAAAEVVKMVNRGVDIFLAERMAFGFDHTIAGYELGAHWRLPKLIQQAMKYHHRPQMSEQPENIGIVYFANQLVKEPFKKPYFDIEVTSKLRMNVSNPEEIREEILEKAELLLKIIEKAEMI